MTRRRDDYDYEPVEPDVPTPESLKRSLKLYRAQTAKGWSALPSEASLDFLEDRYVTQEFVYAMAAVVNAYDEVQRRYELATAKQSRDQWQLNIDSKNQLIAVLESGL